MDNKPVPQRPLGVSLDTRDGFYHWGTAVPQGSINKFLDKVYHDTPSLHWVKIENGEDSIRGHLAAPRVIIPGDSQLNLSRINYQLSFMSGELVSGGKPDHVNLSGWNIVLQCDVATSSINGDPKKDGNAYPEWHFMNRQVPVTEDKNIERLYIKLGEGATGRFSDLTTIINPLTGKKSTFTEWEQQVRHANRSADVPDESPNTFKDFIQTWANSMEARGHTTIAFNVLPSNQDQRAKYSPRKALVQTYPYRDENGRTATGLTGNGNENSLVHLGMAQDLPFPRSKLLSSSVNFRALGPPGTPHGTLVLSHQLFLEIFLLPKLQKLNQATSLRLNTLPHGEMTYEIGSTAESHDDHRSFQRAQDGKSYYSENQVVTSAEPVQDDTFPDREWWYQPEHWSKSSSLFTWDAGQTTGRVQGTVEYCRGIHTSATRDMANSTTYYRELYNCSWKVYVSISVRNGNLCCDLEASTTGYNPPFILHGIRKDISTALEKGISALLRNTGSLLQIDVSKSCLPFYLGTDTFKPSDPIFTKDGGVVINLE